VIYAVVVTMFCEPVALFEAEELVAGISIVSHGIASVVVDSGTGLRACVYNESVPLLALRIPKYPESPTRYLKHLPCQRPRDLIKVEVVASN
jgi:hypothetical protein